MEPTHATEVRAGQTRKGNHSNLVFKVLYVGHSNCFVEYIVTKKEKILPLEAVENSPICTPYDDIKINDPVQVSSSKEGPYITAHFAGVSEKGLPQVWKGGGTSLTRRAFEKVSYSFCKKLSIRR